MRSLSKGAQGVIPMVQRFVTNRKMLRVLRNELCSWTALIAVVLMTVLVMQMDVRAGPAIAVSIEHEMRGSVAALQFSWWPHRATSGLLTLRIDTSAQEATVYRDGTLIGWSIASTGRRGQETPPGSYPILDKREWHRSVSYGDAPMPYMQRLTHDGIAIHGGLVPNYPASRGCIRLPLEFAKLLYAVTDTDTQVIVF